MRPPEREIFPAPVRFGYLQLDVAGKRAFHAGVKRIFIGIVIVVFSAWPLCAQESATQQQLDQLSGKLQDLLEGQAVQGRLMNDLQKQISELRDKVNVPPVADGASHEELRKLARTVQELADKQQADKELILDNIKQLGKAISAEPLVTGSGKKKSSTKKTEAKADPKIEEPLPPGDSQVGHEYKVQPGDSLGVIVKAFRDKGVKVTTAQVLKVNPGLDPNKLFVGRTIFIPDPAAK